MLPLGSLKLKNMLLVILHKMFLSMMNGKLSPYTILEISLMLSQILQVLVITKQSTLIAIKGTTGELIQELMLPIITLLLKLEPN